MGPALLPTPRSGGGCTGGEAAGAAAAGAFVSIAGFCLRAAGGRFVAVAVTVTGGSGVAPEGTAGSAFCAHVAPTVARTAHAEPPRLNWLRTDQIMSPLTAGNNRTESWIVISSEMERREPHDRVRSGCNLSFEKENCAEQMCTTDDFPEAL